MAEKKLKEKSGARRFLGVDVDKIQSFLDYLRLRYSQINGLICWEKPSDLTHLGSCEIGELTHAFFQLGSQRFETIPWSENFNESKYRRLLGEVVQVLLLLHDPELKQKVKGNAPYWSKDMAEVIWLCDAYVKANGGIGIEVKLAGAWLKDGTTKRMPGEYDWIVKEPLPIPPAQPSAAVKA